MLPRPHRRFQGDEEGEYLGVANKNLIATS